MQSEGFRRKEMLIRIQDLELRKIEFREEFQPGSFDLGTEATLVAPVSTSGRAELIEERHGKHEVVQDIRFVGKFATRMEVACARCLEPVGLDVARDFDLLYRPLGADRKADEVSITEAETEIGYYKGDSILLEDVLREQILLAVPLRSLCKEDCKGLCPHCGKNLNDDSCKCDVPFVDPRWAALNDIKQKLK
jgi:uncharacterized protein